jgi:hypothetical protein
MNGMNSGKASTYGSHAKTVPPMGCKRFGGQKRTESYRTKDLCPLPDGHHTQRGVLKREESGRATVQAAKTGRLFAFQCFKPLLCVR